MLLCTRTHFIKSLERKLAGAEGDGTDDERSVQAAAMMERMRLYATDASGLAPGADVWFWSASGPAKAADTEEEKGSFRQLIEGPGPKPGQRVVYVDGGFDLFSSGHIEFLRRVVIEEEELARADGWYSEQNVNERKGKGEDYPPAYVVVGVHEDYVINQWKGVNYPIMNTFERGLCVLQCKVSQSNHLFTHHYTNTHSTSTPSSSAPPSRPPRHTSRRSRGVLPTPSTTARRPSCH